MSYSQKKNYYSKMQIQRDLDISMDDLVRIGKERVLSSNGRTFNTSGKFEVEPLSDT